MAYGHIGSMRAKPGNRGDVIAILLDAADGLRAAGCHLYVVGAASDNDDLVWVYEIWESKVHHDGSLQLPETRAAIGAATPMLTGEFTSQELAIAGGLGVQAAAT